MKKRKKQREIAADTGLCQSYVSRVLNGKVNYTRDVLNAIAASLDILPTALQKNIEAKRLSQSGKQGGSGNKDGTVNATLNKGGYNE